MTTQQSRRQAAIENLEVAELMKEFDPREMASFRLILDYLDREHEGLPLEGDPPFDSEVETVGQHFIQMVDDLGVEAARNEFKRRRDMVKSAKAVAS